MRKIFEIMTIFVFSALASVCYAANWQQIIVFNGTSEQTTDYFTVPTNEWRIIWNLTTSQPQYAMFSVYVYPKGETAAYTTHADSGTNQTNGVLYVHGVHGDFYLKTLTANLDSCTITVQYDATAIPSSSPTPSPAPSPSIPELPIWSLIAIIATLTSAALIATHRKTPK